MIVCFYCFLQHPLLRWKRSAVAAAACILGVRALVVQLGFYLHMQVSTLPILSSFFKIVSLFLS
jgi:hypothetical protein